MTDRHLVTAAHCLAGVEPGLFSMVDILLRHYGGPGAGAAVRRKMEAVTIHPAFNEDTLQNDIAVVRLRRPVSIAPGWLSFLTFSYLSLPFFTFPYLSLPLASVPKFGQGHWAKTPWNLLVHAPR